MPRDRWRGRRGLFCCAVSLSERATHRGRDDLADGLRFVSKWIFQVLSLFPRKVPEREVFVLTNGPKAYGVS